MLSELDKHIEDVLNYHLADYSFEEFLEELDLTPFDVFLAAFNNGLVDEELFFEALSNVDG